jgi:hypothetical protein
MNGNEGNSSKYFLDFVVHSQVFHTSKRTSSLAKLATWTAQFCTILHYGILSRDRKNIVPESIKRQGNKVQMAWVIFFLRSRPGGFDPAVVWACAGHRPGILAELRQLGSTR